jgi:serine/threonine-protein kinase
VERIGHYRIVSELGRGGMGVVYKAHEESLNRFVAIKMLGEHLEQEPEYVERFVREARSAAALSHPNIVQIYAISEENGHHFFVMEYVQGTSVQRMIQSRGKIPTDEAARLILQAAAGLQDAHSQGVVHRDIKPANLMVTTRGLVKIADFGLALMGGATSRLTATGMLMGTPGYLSPEQCLDQAADRRTDIYSLGVTFFEMLTGTMPFRADSPLALLKLIVEVEPPDIRELNPEVDDNLKVIIAKMLAKDRNRRFSSCSEVIAEIQGWLEARGENLSSVAGSAEAGTGAGLAPPPPPIATDEELETQPTMAVESGAAAKPPTPAAPSRRPGDSRAGGAPEAVPATQPGERRSRPGAAPIVAAAATFVVAVAAVGAVLMAKSGVLDTFFERSETPVARLGTDTDPKALREQTSGAEIAPVVGEQDTASGRAEDDPDDTTAATEFISEPAVPVGASQNGTDAGATVVEPSTPSDTSSTLARSAESVHETSPKVIAAEPQQPQIVVRPPTATVVLAVGERLLAVEAEEYLKGRLERAGVEILEVTSIPGLEGLINTEARPSPERIRAALRPYARFLVPVRVDFLGERSIFYMGQRDTAFQARVNLGLVDLSTDRPLGKPSIVTLEYTQLNADRVVAEELRGPTTKVVRQLPRE